jgi:hypothetical protein
MMIQSDEVHHFSEGWVSNHQPDVPGQSIVRLTQSLAIWGVVSCGETSQRPRTTEPRVAREPRCGGYR